VALAHHNQQLRNSQLDVVDLMHLSVFCAWNDMLFATFPFPIRLALGPAVMVVPAAPCMARVAAAPSLSSRQRKVSYNVMNEFATLGVFTVNTRGSQRRQPASKTSTAPSKGVWQAE
jgi:hypothetical protein